VDVLVADSHPALVLIHLDWANPQDGPVGRVAAADPPQDGVDPGHQLARAERLRQVVVSADGQPDEHVRFRVAGCQHEHRCWALRLDAPANL